MTKIAAEPHLDLVGGARTDSAASAAAGAAAGTTGPAAGPALSELVVLLCTFPTAESIGEIGLNLVGEGLCACVNVLHEALSIFRWNDEIASNKEVLCLIKTTQARKDELIARLIEFHPYEVPEIITLATAGVNQPYLQWVNDMTSGRPRSTLRPDRETDDGR